MMSVPDSTNAINLSSLVSQFDQLRSYLVRAVREAVPLKVAEESILAFVVSMGRQAIDALLASQGNGDLGESVVVEGRTLVRSAEPRERPLRTLFGEHSYSAYVYGRDVDRKIEFRPIDARLLVPAGKFSPKLHEILHRLDAEMAFGQAAEFFHSIFGQHLSVNSLERNSGTLGNEAEDFLHQVPIPAPAAEGAILVSSADAKGVPMIRDEPKPLPAFEKRAYPGNRQMATLATVYSVDPFVRTAEQVVDALFREPTDEPAPKRPKPVGKVVVGCMTRLDDEDQPLPGEVQAFAWMDEQIERRHQLGQPLVRLMDGQVSLWDTAKLCLNEHPAIEILDLIHVSSYVWTAAKLLYPHRESQEWFTRDRLTRILNGDVGGVIAGLRQSATKRDLSQKDRAAIEKVCKYFEKNRLRMRYDEYLHAGYPIATGVIEGACRHLVMDRMCRTGMRWSLAGSQAMLNIRAVHQAEQTEAFHNYRADRERNRTAKFRPLLQNYEPLTLCG